MALEAGARRGWSQPCRPEVLQLGRATAVGVERRGSEVALGCGDEGESRAAGDPQVQPFAKKCL